jgi:hypothetical protein
MVCRPRRKPRAARERCPVLVWMRGVCGCALDLTSSSTVANAPTRGTKSAVMRRCPVAARAGSNGRVRWIAPAARVWGG